MKSLVTGGGGFLGKEIVKQLLARGDEVIAIGRNHYPEVEKMGARSIVADIRDKKKLVQLFDQVDEVYHTAALAGIWGRWEDYYSINTQGSLAVIQACVKNKVPRLIYTSSPSVVFDGKSQCGINEDAPYSENWLADYPKTKALAEKAILKANEKNGLATVALRPHLIWGPGDHHVIPRLLDRARKGRLLRVGTGENLVDMIYIENAARAHLQVSEQLGSGGACSGKVYFIGQGKPLRLWDFIGEILERSGLPPVKRSISFKMAYKIGFLMETIFRLLRRQSEPRMTRFLACQLATDHYYDDARARKDFGYDPKISTEEGLKRLFSKEGLL